MASATTWVALEVNPDGTVTRTASWALSRGKGYKSAEVSYPDISLKSPKEMFRAKLLTWITCQSNLDEFV